MGSEGNQLILHFGFLIDAKRKKHDGKTMMWMDSRVKSFSNSTKNWPTVSFTHNSHNESITYPSKHNAIHQNLNFFFFLFKKPHTTTWETNSFLFDDDEVSKTRRRSENEEKVEEVQHKSKEKKWPLQPRSRTEVQAGRNEGPKVEVKAQFDFTNWQ